MSGRAGSSKAGGRGRGDPSSPKRPQEESKRLQKGSNRPQEASKTPQDHSKWPQERPQRPQDPGATYAQTAVLLNFIAVNLFLIFKLYSKRSCLF